MPMDQFSSSEGFWWAQVREPIMDPAPKILSSAYKSLIPQHNALWGAQFYEAEAASTAEQPAAAAAAAAEPEEAAMFRAPHGTLNFHPYQEDTHTYEEEDTDEQIMEERDNIEAVYREDDHQEQGSRAEEQVEEEETEHMFEKPLTPSDVGKLNRLVIPKQHAERYFPLGGAGGSGGGESGGGEKGLLLSFEDESGKGWRFRYSYWNSSQSYVLTKGWSRFVKEKRLDAGDVVLFERHRVNGERFYIRWRRRATPVQDSAAAVLPLPQGPQQHDAPPLMGAWTRILYSGPTGPAPLPPPSHHHHHHHHQYYQAHHSHGSPLPPPILYQADFLHADITTPRGALAPVVQNPTAPGNWKRLRLFGVNLECQMLDDEEDPQAAYPSPMPEEASSSPSGHYFSPSLQPDQSVHHGSTVFLTAHKEQEDTLSFQRDINHHTRNIPCRPDLSM